MKYMGSKSRIAKYIVPIIQSYIDETGHNYLEPFCGGCNVIDKINTQRRFASDANKYLIALWQNINRLEELPAFVDKSLYDSVRSAYNNQTNEYEDWYIGAIGFLASYNGRFFDGGYAGIGHEKNGKERNYYDECKRNILAQREDLIGVKFACRSYEELTPKNLVIYCDPPYQDTKGYTTSKGFDYDNFWKVMREWSKNNVVLVSEMNAPNDVEAIWEKPVLRSQRVGDKFTATEKLYKL